MLAFIPGLSANARGLILHGSEQINQALSEQVIQVVDVLWVTATIHASQANLHQSTIPMLNVTRSPDGTIESVTRHAQPGSETMAPDHPELQAFLGGAAPAPGFSESDAEFVRVLEDLIDTLILKNVIRHTDLPPAAQQKLLRRKGLRNRMQGALNLLDGEGQTI